MPDGLSWKPGGQQVWPAAQEGSGVVTSPWHRNPSVGEQAVPAAQPVHVSVKPMPEQVQPAVSPPLIGGRSSARIWSLGLHEIAPTLDELQI
ncbi:MAG: hypothetical protein IT385_27270 [Deltaproteobacteria bacterium]|nr:hypothetical protein [Deltaproteobacteria bacterium]